ncbi:hypothetical protein [Protaetiibacter larvae]|uniref:PH domain-containing protein n=1 Tax=Protaetiibacter larvae TaxID=2592654 RepID=A0A5C1Y9M7_9MICO|nr:hypothetical protein [Protaetiibacter larvae]QEO10591.1 hypothetical protein FLP23_11615 [Protaetiibacter larvae]
MSATPDDLTAVREFQPSWAAFHRRFLARMLMLGPLLLLVVIVAAWPSIGLALVLLGAAGVLGGLGLAVYFGRVRVTVQPGRVTVRGPLRTRSWRTDELAAAVLVPQPGAALMRPGSATATLYLVSVDDRRLFWLSGGLWERDALDELAAAIGVQVITVPPGLLAEEIRDRYPGTIGWTAVHPWLFALVLAASAAAVMFIVLVLTTVVLIATGELQLPTPG